MKFKNDVLLLNKEDCSLVFGDYVALKITGPIKDDLAICIEAGTDYLEVFNKFPASEELNSIIAVINEYLSDNKPSYNFELDSAANVYQLDKHNVIEVIDLTSNTDLPSSLEVYAKDYDPTAMVGPGG